MGSFNFGLGLVNIANNLLTVLEKVSEVERHLHGWERWFGAAVVPNAPTHVADRIGVSSSPFVVDAGNNDWGSWVQILGTDDTPADVGMVKYDPHRIMVTALERTNVVHLLQMGWGTSGADALANGTYSELVFEPQTAQNQEFPIDIQMRRADAGEALWIRIKIPGTDTGTMDFFLGIHEYEE